MTKGKDRKTEREREERALMEDLITCQKTFLLPPPLPLSPSPSLFFHLNFGSFFPFVNNSWVNFINANPRCLKCQNMAFKLQKWRLTIIKLYKTFLAFKTPKSTIFIANIDILNAKNKAF